MKTASLGIYLSMVLGASLMTACASNQAQISTPTQAISEHSSHTVNYEVNAYFAENSVAGKATLYRERSGHNYRATLKIAASPIKFSSNSEGDIRANTFATTRFQSGYKLLGNVGGGSRIVVDYAAKQYTLGSNGVQELPFDTVFDELSMIGHLQHIVENNIKQGRIHLPVFQQKTIQLAAATFGKPERVSTYAGVFENAIPVTVQFPSGSIQSIRILFAQTQASTPQKYTPVWMSWQFNSGKIDLVYRGEQR